MMNMKTFLVSVVMLLAFSVNPIFAAPPENSSDVINHLEFMGYEVSIDSVCIRAKHSKNLNMVIKKYRGGMLATTYFGGREYGKANTSSWLELINKLNQKAAVARYYVDNDGDMVIEGYYPGDYNKKSFSAFLDAFNIERNHLAELGDEIKKYLE